jgi:hypothetical protein
MLEAAVVFNTEGEAIYWHLPEDRSGGYIPDNRDLWEVLWTNRETLGGVAHTHPWKGPAVPSTTDLTTFAAIEEALGKRLLWPLITFTNCIFLKWEGPSRLNYVRTAFTYSQIPWIDQLRKESQ